MRRFSLVLFALLVFSAPFVMAEEAVTPVAAPVVSTAPVATPVATPVVAPVAVETAPAPVLKVVEKVEEVKVEAKDPVPEDPEEIILLIKQLIGAGKSGQWAIFAGLLITLLVWLLRKFNVIAFLPDKVVPWVAATLVSWVILVWLWLQDSTGSTPLSKVSS